ncbi:MAG: hypothetical protein IJ409_06030 [Lachnospiraceae bacterium]|nr:hypothetical protein [Lachnospiraceae bacterium]
MKKVLTGLLAFLPIIFLGISLVMVFAFMLMYGAEETLSGSEMIFPIAMIVLAFVAVILTYAAMIIYIVMACKNPAFSTGWKIGWACIFYFFNVFAFPVYWFRHICFKKS